MVAFVEVTTLMQAEARQRVLVAELQHRTRNLLAIVQAMAQRTLDKGEALDNFSARLAALGRIQGLVGGSADIELGELVTLELQGIGAPESRASIAGPKIRLGLQLAQTFGLALHELATNALKHGAFKSDLGRLEVSWTIRREAGTAPILVLDWRETGVPDAGQPSRRGFGRDLIEKALVFTLRAKTEFSFRNDGVSCRIELPLPSDKIQRRPAAEGDTVTTANGPLEGRRILVVEDDYMVAEILVALLKDAGADVVGPIGWLDEALACVIADKAEFDSAVLDINLHGRMSYPVADALVARAINFVFATGYGAAEIDRAYRDHPRCEKPFNQKKLIAALKAVGAP